MFFKPAHVEEHYVRALKPTLQNFFLVLWALWILAALGLFLSQKAIPNYPDSWLPEWIEPISQPPSPPSSMHFLGTDELGRDLLIRILFGTAYSLLFSTAVAVATTLIGLGLGIASSFLPPLFKNMVSRLIEIVTALPFLPLALGVAAFSPGNLFLIGLLKVFLSWGTLAQLARLESERVFQGTMITAARSEGLSGWQLGFRYILPSLSPLLLGFFPTLLFSSLLSLSALDFWGLGFSIPTPTLAEGFRQALDFPQAWWLWLTPLTVLLFLLMGLKEIQKRFYYSLPPLAY